MTQQPIRFDDGAVYERMMGAWSQLVGLVILGWLSPAPGQRWTILTEMRTLGVTPALPPGVRASRMGALHGLWTDAGVEGIEPRAITVQRSFDSFDNFSQVITAAGVSRAALELIEPDAIAELKERVRGSLSADGHGRIRFGACGNAIKGHVPKSP